MFGDDDGKNARQNHWCICLGKSVIEQHNFIVGYFCSSMVYRYTCILGTGLVTSLTANQTQTRNHYYIYIYK